MLRYARQAEHHGAKLICFPECYLQGYLLEPQHAYAHGIALNSASFASILKRLESLDLTLVFGMIEAQGNAFFNTAVVVSKGVLMGAYRKAHLMRAEAKFFSPGVESPIFDLEGIQFGLNICKDLNFPECAKQVAAQGAQLLVCPCNNMLKPDAAREWKDNHNAIRSLRCTESKLWLLSSDVTGTREGYIAYGPTAIISPDGHVMAQAPLNEPGAVSYEIDFSSAG